MNRLISYLLLMNLFLFAACGSDVEETEENDTDGNAPQEEQTSETAEDPEAESELTSEGEESEETVEVSEPANDWEFFKEAVQAENIRGIGGMVGSDEIDSEALINEIKSNSAWMEIMDTKTIDDLVPEEAGDGSQVLKMTISTDPEGASGLFLYFSEQEDELILEYYLNIPG